MTDFTVLEAFAVGVGRSCAFDIALEGDERAFQDIEQQDVTQGHVKIVSRDTCWYAEGGLCWR
jgi:hypothetical protein